MFGGLVKAVVDINQRVMVVDADMHSDEEELLLEGGSKQEDIWVINLYPEKFGTYDFVEFDSMINLRPSYGNNTRGVDNQLIQEVIKKIVQKLVKP